MPPDDPNPTPPTEPPRTFTQDELNAILAKQTRPLRERTTAAESKLAEYEAANTALRESGEHMQAKLDATLAARNQAERRVKEIEATSQAAIAEARGQATEALRAHHVQQSLLASKVFTGAIGDAATIFRSELELELGADGLPAKVTHAGKEYPDLQSAASAFLATRPHFTPGATGGTGTRPPTGGRINKPEPSITGSSPAELAGQGWAKKPEGSR